MCLCVYLSICLSVCVLTSVWLSILLYEQLVELGDSSPPLSRDWLVDTLSLLAMRSLSSEECNLRNKHWLKTSYSWWLFSSSNRQHQLPQRRFGQVVDPARKQEAELFSEVLVGSIQVTLTA